MLGRPAPKPRSNGLSRGPSWFKKFFIGTATLALGAGLSLAWTPLTAAAADGSVSGTVFRDYNVNGAMDTAGSPENPAVDVGVAGVAVAAFDAAGDEVGAATTAADGTYTLTYSTGDATTDVRLEFTVPDGFVSSRAGVSTSTSGTTVQFVASGSTADLGLYMPGDFAAPDPLVVTPLQRGAIQSFNDPAPGERVDVNLSALVSAPASATGRDVVWTSEATTAQIGTVFGTANIPGGSAGYVFTSALTKRNAVTGPGGPGAIYLTDIGVDPNGTVFATIPDAGDPRPSENLPGYDWYHDLEVVEEVFTTGLGGLVVTGDRSALYTVNLNDRQLYQVPVSTPLGLLPVAGAPAAIPMPIDLPGAEQGCADELTRPFGLGIDGLTLYAGITCVGPDTAALRSYIYTYDLVTETFSPAPVLEYEIGFPRGCGSSSATCIVGGSYPSVFDGGDGQSSAWNPWAADPWAINTQEGARVLYPQPIVSDITIDRTGDLAIAYRDRTGDMVGWHAGKPDPADGTDYTNHVSGDVLKACGNGVAGWELESNAVCGGVTGAAPDSNRGPGGGEFYDGTYRANAFHDNTWVGGTEEIPGHSGIRTTAFDPVDMTNSGGTKVAQIEDGSFHSGAQIFWTPFNEPQPDPDDVGTMGKSGGLGDLTALVLLAPVEIGNRVWLDTDGDGIQDPGEAPVEGVTVQLACIDPIDSTFLSASTSTDAAGEYYFNDENVPQGMPGAAECSVSFSTTGTTAEGLPLTAANTGDNDAIDSDAEVIDAGDRISFTSPAEGADHTFDVGYMSEELCSVGDFVWTDTDGDGIQDEGEAGVPNVTVELINADGEVVDTVTTDADGAYEFVGIECGTYTIRFSDIPEGSEFTPPGEGDDPEVDSNPDPETGETPPFTVGGDEPNDDPTIDAGIVPADDVCSVGDYVWNDGNGNGIQDEGEIGVPDVTVELINADGDVVATVTTDENGAYMFEGVECGTYTIRFSDLPGDLTLPGEGNDPSMDSNPDPETGETPPFTIGGDEPNDDPTIDAGVKVPPEMCTVGDFVWMDSNANGIQDEGEAGIPNVRVEIIDELAGGEVVGTTTTDADGAYSISIGCGEYTIRFSDLPAGAEFTEPGVGDDPAKDSNPDPETGVTPPFTLGEDPLDPADNDDPTIDAGVIVPPAEECSIGDYVWNDTDGDGIQDEGEAGVPNVKVELINSDGEVVATVMTDSDGAYTFEGIECGTYTIRFSDLPDGSSLTPPGEGEDPGKDSNPDPETGVTPPVTVTPEDPDDPDVDAGVVPPIETCAIGDYVWYDDNGNGVQDGDEDPAAGVTVTLLDSEGNAVAEVETDADGKYLFDDIECGTYRVKFSGLPNGYKITGPGQGGDPAKDSNPLPATGITGEITVGGDAPKNLTIDAGIYKPDVPNLPGTGADSMISYGLIAGTALAAAGALALIGRRRRIDSRH